MSPFPICIGCSMVKLWIGWSWHRAQFFATTGPCERRDSQSEESAKCQTGWCAEVNQAAGNAAQVKIQELEEDMASDVEAAEQTVRALDVVREFCLSEKSYTYFLVDFRDKEMNSHLYSILTDLMDARLIHVVDARVSNPNLAERRSEAVMLDLSQFSGSRLKQKVLCSGLPEGADCIPAHARK